jgi:hypothetical protein
MSTTTCYDAITVNVGGLPAGQRAGYDTGGSIIAWTPAQWAANPGAVHIDQDGSASVPTSDILDVESGAATIGDIPSWLKRASAAFSANSRPGQRWPCVYTMGSNLAAATSAIESSGVPGVGIWYAHPGVSQSTANSEVAGGYIGVQYAWPGYGLPSSAVYDISEFNTAWLSDQSGVQGNTISQGSSGPAVIALQTLMNDQGSGLTVDGLFGTGTLGAVLGFQGAHGLKEDGVVGPATWAAIEAAAAPPSPPGVPQTAPEGITTSYGNSGLTISFGAVGGATQYGYNFNNGHSATTTVTHGTFSIATIGDSGQFKLRAGNTAGWGEWGQPKNFAFPS